MDQPVDFDIDGVKNTALELLKSGKPIYEQNGALVAQFHPFLTTGEKEGQAIPADFLERDIIRCHCMGLGNNAILTYVKSAYAVDIKLSEIVRITDNAEISITNWRDGPLDAVYVTVWLDSIDYKVKKVGDRKATRRFHNIWGINAEGLKHFLGQYITERDKGPLWSDIFNNLKRRGVKDILIACIENEKHLKNAIRGAYPQTEIQGSIAIHFIKSVATLPSKDMQEVKADMYGIYKSGSKAAADRALQAFEKKWETQYPLLTKLWRNEWPVLSPYFSYPKNIRRLIYTSSPAEAYHKEINSVIKTVDLFPDNTAMVRLVYIVTQRMMEEWAGPFDWESVLPELKDKFGKRMQQNARN